MMKLGRSLGGLVAVVFLTASAVAQPDLVVSGVRIDPEVPRYQSVVAVSAVVTNVGTEALRTGFDVLFGDNGKEISRSTIAAGFGVGESREIFAAWVAELGNHALSVAVDQPLDAVRETDEENNARVLSVTVREGAAPRVAVVEFDDRSRAHLDNLGVGVADKLAARLAAGGIRVVDRGEADSWMREVGLDPRSPDALAFAANELGVDYVITGVVDSVTVASQTLDLGIVRLSSAQAYVSLSAQLVSAVDGALRTEEASGSGKGTTNLSLYFGSPFSASPSCDVCAGGLVSEKDAYFEGELVSIGYQNTAAPGWFGLELYASDDTFLRWLGWRFIGNDECETWVWNQRDALGSPMDPGIYIARLRDGDLLADTVTFQIRPGLSLTFPSLDQVTVGTTAFDGDALGIAIDDAVARLSEQLLAALFKSGAAEPAERAAGTEPVLLGQIASTLADGRVTINIGSSSGVAVGDRFEVVAVDHVMYDPETLSIVSYDAVASKGRIEIIEVRERAAIGICLDSFDPSVGDLVRLLS